MALTKIGSSGITANALTSLAIANGTIQAVDLADGAVTNAKLAGSITSDKITSVANTAITGLINTAQIANAAITTALIANNSIITEDIVDRAITAAKIANTAVTAGIYGGTNSALITIDAQGRITAASNVAAGAFPAGTRMSFQQTSAPTGWTKDTTASINDAMLRLVTGTTANGGTTAFSTWNNVTATGATTLDVSQIPSHTHPMNGGGTGAGDGHQGEGGASSTGATGGGGSHTHSITRSLKYYDFIIASKD
jgi:ligand-binding sensor domain-containing protein